ncbi:MAG: hypothetical protein AB7G47_09870 [Mycolicibacterium sp.]|uniref:MinD/ParA family ATP-binding protein n=1 Tax=Mycolicibacterium sp. TaxID=2320850 RepID=UPI003D10E6AE
MSDTNRDEFVSPPEESADEAHPVNRPPADTEQAPTPPAPDALPPAQQPTPTPPQSDERTRQISPDLVASVLNQNQGPPPSGRDGDPYQSAQAPAHRPAPRETYPAPPPVPPLPPRAQPDPQHPGYSHDPYGGADYRQSVQDNGWNTSGRATLDQLRDHDAVPARGPARSSSLVERLSPDVLAPPAKPEPTRGWRKAALTLTGGLVNPGLSTAEEAHAGQVNTIISRLSGDCYRIGVLVGKGGTGKTTVATIIASILAEYRCDDRVVAVDADPAFGKLANRVAPQLSQTYWELLADEDTGRLRRWTDVKASLGSNPHTGLWLLRGEHRSRQRRLINPAVYQRAMDILGRYLSIAVIDCGAVLEHPLMEAVLPTLDAVVVVGALEQGAGEATAQTLAWLEDNGYHRLLNNGVVVLNDPRGRAHKRTRATMYRDFTTHVDAATVMLPYDKHLSAGGVIDTRTGLSRATRQAAVEITAHLARGFAATTLDGQRR